jgi:hypothetical protein
MMFEATQRCPYSIARSGILYEISNGYSQGCCRSFGQVSTRRTRARTATDGPTLLARIERAIYRLRNTHGLPLKPLADGSDPEEVLTDCALVHQQLRQALMELREATLEQVGLVQTHRLGYALKAAVELLDK